MNSGLCNANPAKKTKSPEKEPNKQTTQIRGNGSLQQQLPVGHNCLTEFIYMTIKVKTPFRESNMGASASVVREFNLWEALVLCMLTHRQGLLAHLKGIKSLLMLLDTLAFVNAMTR